MELHKIGSADCSKAGNIFGVSVGVMVICVVYGLWKSKALNCYIGSKKSNLENSIGMIKKNGIQIHTLVFFTENTH